MAFSKGSKIRTVNAAGSSELLTVRSISHDGSKNTIVTVEPTTVALAAADLVYFATEEVEHANEVRSSLTANGAHSMLECAGQGICDRATGNCECFPGYEGEACTRSVCPNDCSGNGIC